MSSWQGRTRFFIGVFAVLFATVVLFTIRERSEPVPVAFERIDPEAVVESTGMEIIQMLGGSRSTRSTRNASSPTKTAPFVSSGLESRFRRERIAASLSSAGWRPKSRAIKRW